jgi:DNA-binding NtrC family response regulator
VATILLADDNEELLQMQCAVLREAGHHVTTAVTGAEALRHAKRSSFDILITDIIMPEGDGYETIVQVRRHHPRTKIIAISGGGLIGAQHYLPIARKLGACNAFSKPITATELLGIVSWALASASAV